MGIRLDREVIAVMVNDSDGRLRVEERPGCYLPTRSPVLELAEDQAEQLRLINRETHRRGYREGFVAGKLSVYQSMIEDAVTKHSN